MTSTNIEKINYSKDNIGISGLSIDAGSKKLLINESLSLKKGRKYGVIGKNGSGKTSMLKYLFSLLQNDALYIDQYISNEEWKDINIVDAILFANKERNELLKKINHMNENDIDNLNEMYDYSINIDSDSSQVKKILNGLGFLNNDFGKTYYDFSGGWKTRISLARALYMKPNILFLDEPTNHLDMEAIYWIENYLKNYSGILLFVSHNIRFLNEVGTDIIHLYSGKLKQYSGSYYIFKKQLIQDKKKILNDYEKLQKELKKMREKGKIKEAQELEKKKTNEGILRPERDYKITMNFERSGNNNKTLISLNNISFGYDKNKLIFKNLNLRIKGNDRITIVGKNGCGKSTLIKLLTQTLKPLNGEIINDDRIIISYFHQHSIEELPDDKTPVEYIQSINPELSVEEIRKLLGMISLEGKQHVKKIKVLSGGERMRIAFVEVIIKKPDLLLLDEPTNHLDLETIECLIDSLNEYDGSIVIISHDINIIEETRSKVFHLENGKLNFLENGIDDYLEKFD